MKYKISCHNPSAQVFDIELSFKNTHNDVIFLQLSSWRPGRYELGNFARNILNIRAISQSDNSLRLWKVKKDRWQLEGAKSGELISIKYQYYASVMDGGGTYVDHQQWYINFINCLIYAEGHLDERCSIELILPETYKIACGMKQTNETTLTAPNYYQAVDSPMMASASLQHFQYNIADKDFHMWFIGDHVPNKDKTLSAFSAFSEQQIACFGELPCDDYHFLYQLLPYKSYHGVEHFNSTIICLGPSEKINEQELWESFLGVSSHELFHVWNIIRIRPAEMWPYDFTQENYFRTGYVAEGFTTYYGDLFLLRADVFDEKWYLNELNKSLKRHFENFGRFNLSLADSSFDTWLDGYSPGIPNRKVSIYIKGSLVSMMLDLCIRIYSDHKYSLDDIMRALYSEFYKQNKGYSEADIVVLAERYAGRSMDDFFAQYIYGTEPIEEEMRKILSHFGLKLVPKHSSSLLENQFGIRIDESQRVVKIIPGTEAYEKLQLQDELVAVNNRKLDGNEKEIMKNHKTLDLRLFRQNRLVEIQLNKSEHACFSFYEIILDEEASAQQEKNRAKWWGKIY